MGGKKAANKQEGDTLPATSYSGTWVYGLIVALAAVAVANHLGASNVMDTFFSGDGAASAEWNAAREGYKDPAIQDALKDSTVQEAMRKAQAMVDERNKAVDALKAEMASLPADCVDSDKECITWAIKGECTANPGFMLDACRRSCKACAPAKKPDLPKAGAASEDEDEACKDESPSCGAWATAGECENNPKYMRGSCPVACGTCEERKSACNRTEGSRAITEQPGGLNALFERALADFPEYSPQVLHRDPWVLAFHDFLRDEEIHAILGHCNDSFARSMAGDQVSPVRTSTQCWCSTEACVNDPHVKALTARLTALTGIGESNMEYAQIVHYEPGQFYKVHHDQNSAHWTPQGVRLLTFFMYANDVEAGGGTRFTDLGITYQPRKGAAILWPSVTDADLDVDEPMTHHEALPPEAGSKVGINVWLHQYDFRTPSTRGCKWATRNTNSGPRPRKGP